MVTRSEKLKEIPEGTTVSFSLSWQVFDEATKRVIGHSRSFIVKDIHTDKEVVYEV